MREAAFRLLLLVLAVLALAACGDDDATPAGDAVPLRLALDFTPNAVHAPIYAATGEGLDRREGVALSVQPPAERPDSVKAVLSGAADVGVLDIHDLALAREGGADVVAFAALVTRPLGALVARDGIGRPRDLEGKTVGVSGLPSDPAFVNAIVRADGGDPKRVKSVTIGFNGVSALATKRVDAVPVFWNVEGVVLQRRRVAVNEFRVDDFGAPPYPEVVLFAARRTIEERPEDLRKLVRALGAGMQVAKARPREVAERIAEAALTKDVALVEAQLEALRDATDTSLRFDPPVLARWAAFGERIGLVERRADVDRAFVTTLAGPRPSG